MLKKIVPVFLLGSVQIVNGCGPGIGQSSTDASQVAGC